MHLSCGLQQSIKGFVYYMVLFSGGKSSTFSVTSLLNKIQLINYFPHYKIVFGMITSSREAKSSFPL